MLLQEQVIKVKPGKFKMVTRLLDLDPMQVIKSGRRLSMRLPEKETPMWSSIFRSRLSWKIIGTTIDRRGAKWQSQCGSDNNRQWKMKSGSEERILNGSKPLLQKQERPI
jgi:hydrogenase maturation factor